MESTDLLLKGRIHYYGREGYFQAMQNVSVEGIKKLGNDPVYRFYSAVAHLLQGLTQEAIRQLQPLVSDNMVGLGVVTALLQAHRKYQQVDKEAVAQLDATLKEDRKKASDVQLYYAGLFLFLANRNDKAREYIDRMLKINPDSIEGSTLKGWIEIYAGKDTKIRNINQLFDNVLERKPKYLDALFGKAKYYESLDQYQEAMDVLNNMVVAFPGLTPPLIQKIRVNLASQDWDQMLEAANRVLSMDSHDLEALKYRTVHGICRVGPSSDPGQSLKSVYNEMDRTETNNAALFIQMAQLFSRLCGRNPAVLEETYMMASRAAKVDTGSAEYLTEVGYQCLLLGRIKEATKFYRNATKLDESSVTALTGIITCQLLDGQIDMAEQQLDFLKEVQRTLGAAPDILYLSAVLSRLKKESPEKCIALLNEAIENHYKQLRGQGFGTTYLTALNPDFLLMIVQEGLLYAPAEDSLAIAAENLAGSSDISNKGSGESYTLIKRCGMVLESVSQACPALLPALLLTARIKMIIGDLRAANATLTHIIDNIGHTSSEARLLMAQVQLKQGNYKQAQQSLEVGLSFNFEVRELPMYHLIRARILKKQGTYSEAIKTLNNCLQLAKNKPSGHTSTMVMSVTGAPSTDLSLMDLTSVYLEKVDCHLLAGQHDLAAQVMEEARVALKGTGQEMRLSVASADLSLSRGDTQQALATLRAVPNDNQYYMTARHKMADIYLHHLNDKRMFASCYKELVDQSPTTQNFLVLGDAYMCIQEPDRAIEIYEQAVKRTPRDPELACRMGRALVKTHQYSRAVNYYKDAIKTGSNNQLRYDMAELLMRMSQHDKAEKAINQALEFEAQNTDITSMVMQAKLFNLLAKVYERWTGKFQQAMDTLRDAKEVQVKVLKRAQVELPDTLPQQKKMAASMCSKMAEHAANQRKNEDAIQLYKEALDYVPDESDIMLALAKLYLQTNNMEMCQKTCSDLLRLDKDNDGATVMMADLSYRRNQYDTAMFHFQQLLERQPTHYSALARLLEVMRRTGTLEEAEPYMQRATQATHRPTPGMFFCQGLLDWYLGNPNSALKQFNQARKDQEWGQKSIYNMIEICLNPDNDTLGGETFHSVDEDLHRDSNSRDTHEMAIRTADKLLKELKPTMGAQQVSYQVLGGLLLLATRQKSNAEAALQVFMEIAGTEQYKDHVGAIYGMATAYMMLKQTPRARNQLKRVAKSPWSFEDAEYLERCWLLLADIYVQSSKYDVAIYQLKRVLEHNKSCMKAYEYMGFIMEKEQSYRDAAFHYEQAWRYCGKTNPMIGYKLAFNYMKAKRYVDAIDVCHSVLEKHPEYPRIRKEILEKCRGMIRV